MWVLIFSVILLISLLLPIREPFGEHGFFTYNPLNFGGSRPRTEPFGQLVRSLNVANPLVIEDPLTGQGHDQKAARGRFIAIRTRPLPEGACTYDLQGKRVGYIDRSLDLNFIKAIMHGYRQDKSTVTMVEVPMHQWNQLASLDTLDIIICFCVPDSPFEKLLQQQRVYLYGFKGIDIDRLHVFYPFLQLERDFPIRERLAGSLCIIPEEKTDVVLMQPVIVPFVETFITRIKRDPIAEDREARCFGEDDPTVSYYRCISPYDVFGQPKATQTVWDKPCKQDSDCPFFNEKRGRGGCRIDRLCELPVGVERLGYRKYRGEPFFYGDYIFPNDSIFIPME